MRCARYRRRRRNRVTFTLTRAEAAEVLALALGATFGETEPERRDELTAALAKLTAAALR